MTPINTTEEHVKEMEEAAENTEPLDELASALVDAAVSSTARESGRTVEGQWKRMGDGFAFLAAEQHPYQMQLTDYAISGGYVEVERWRTEDRSISTGGRPGSGGSSSGC